MAIKGDYEECEKCTSFQCNTCGLESRHGEGYITGLNNALKVNGLCILGYFYEIYNGTSVSVICLVLPIMGTVLMYKLKSPAWGYLGVFLSGVYFFMKIARF